MVRRNTSLIEINHLQWLVLLRVNVSVVAVVVVRMEVVMARRRGNDSSRLPLKNENKKLYPVACIFCSS